MPWQYETMASTNGQVNVNGSMVGIAQALNMLGSANWELAAVVPLGPGSFEFVFQRPAQ